MAQGEAMRRILRHPLFLAVAWFLAGLMVGRAFPPDSTIKMVRQRWTTVIGKEGEVYEEVPWFSFKVSELPLGWGGATDVGCRHDQVLITKEKP